LSSEDKFQKRSNINTNGSSDAKTISSDVLIQLYNAGFRKLVPLHTDSKRANVYGDLITEEEIKKFQSAEGKPVRIIHQDSSFWSEIRLREKAYLFHNVSTTFGLTDLKDSKARPLYLYGVDVDTKEAYEALKELIEMLKGITYVVKSHKEYGYHFYVLTSVFHEAIGRASFKLGAEIEVKTDISLGTMHLPPSRHRRYPYWTYERVSTAESIYIDEDDTVFQKIIKAMSPYLRKEPTEEKILTLDAYPSQASGPNLLPSGLQQQRQQPHKSLTTEQIDKAVDVILNHSNSYTEYARNDFVFGLAGHLFHNLISESSTTRLVGKLCKEAKDEEADERSDVVTETYKKGRTGKPIRGISQLKYLLTKYNNENEVRVNEIIAELNEALKIVTAASGTSGISTNSASLGRGDPAAEAMVEFAESNGDIFFKDTFGQPFAITNIGNHVQVISMESKKFAYHLRTLLKRNTEQRILSNDSVEKAIEALKTEAIVEGRTIPLHLRVAWKKKNEVIYYDRTDETWSCIAIERDAGTWRVLPAGSLTGYPIAELHNPNSKLSDQPVLFTRYSQAPQVMADRSYPPDIMQQFLDKCTNIKDPKDQLLFKAYIITLFIPEMAHPILLLKGVKGAAKSILQTEVKRIIDPSEIELLILNKKEDNFIINLAHNYYNAYDNVRKIPEWLSSDICAATTGAGFSTRTLFTTADETHFKFKRCFSLSSIGASLTEDDALERCISLMHPKIARHSRKTEEKILSEFDSILPLLLGYILDMVAKTLQIKDQLEQSNELEGYLGRMADFCLCGEAAARAMGYKPMEFLTAYSENLKNQSRDAVNFNALADVVQEICQEELGHHKRVVEYSLPQLLAKVREKANEMGIDIDGYGTKFSWAKTPQSLSAELIQFATLIEESYGYKLERYLDTVGRKGRKKNNSVIRITNLNIQSKEQKKSKGKNSQVQKEVSS
jgi:hypothetical protein